MTAISEYTWETRRAWEISYKVHLHLFLEKRERPLGRREELLTAHLFMITVLSGSSGALHMLRY